MKLTSSKALQMLESERDEKKNNHWIDHSINVGNSAGRIAKALNLDADYATALGYIHDIGKKFKYLNDGVFSHAMEGYKYIKSLGYDEEYAGICIKHSFLNNDIDCLANNADETDKNNPNYEFVKEYIKDEYSIYEKIINLCDLMCSTRILPVNRRMIDLISRHGVYDKTFYHINETFKLKEFFDDLLGYNLYELFPEIKDSISLNDLVILQAKYSKELEHFSPESIQKALQVLNERRKRVQKNDSNWKEKPETLDEQTEEIFDLMSKYEQEVKNIFINHNECVTYITSISPDNMNEGKILKSRNRENHYQTARGNWVFASSEPIEYGNNPYIARNKYGMILIFGDTYVYGNDNMKVTQDSQGQNHVILREPNYAYKITPRDFNPVVTLKTNHDGKPYFEFSEEWVCNDDIDISDSTKIKEVQKITDVTDLIGNYQVFCDVNQTGEGIKIRNASTREEIIQLIVRSIKNGNLRYINNEANINIHPKLKELLERENFTLEENGDEKSKQ